MITEESCCSEVAYGFGRGSPSISILQQELQQAGIVAAV